MRASSSEFSSIFEAILRHAACRWASGTSHHFLNAVSAARTASSRSLFPCQRCKSGHFLVSGIQDFKASSSRDLLAVDDEVERFRCCAHSVSPITIATKRRHIDRNI